MEEVLTIRVPKGTRRRLERRAKAQKLSVSLLVRRALEHGRGRLRDRLLTVVVDTNAPVVTGDQDLLVIRSYNGIDIVSPRDFLSRFSYRT